MKRAIAAIAFCTLSASAYAQDWGIETCLIPNDTLNATLAVGQDFTSFLEPDEQKEVTDHPLHGRQLSTHPLYYENLFLKNGMNELTAEQQLTRQWRVDHATLIREFELYSVDSGLDLHTPNMESFRKTLQEFNNAKVPNSGDLRPTHNDSCVDDPATAANDECGLWGSVYQYNRIDTASLKIPCDALVSSAEDMAIYQFANTLYNYSYSRAPILFSETAYEASRVYETHKLKLENGLPMWPWETFVNGIGALDVQEFEDSTIAKNEATHRQLLFFRPSISPALQFDGEENSQVDAALTIEPIGAIWYEEGSDFKKWKGVSLLVSLTHDNGVGYGGAYRVNNWMLGAARHSKTDDWMIYASIDLYDLIAPKDERTSNANTFLEGLAKHLTKKSNGQPE